MRHLHAGDRASRSRRADVRRDRTVDVGRNAPIGEHLARAVRIRNAGPGGELRAGERDRAGDVIRLVTCLVEQRDHQLDLVERRAGLVDQGPQRTLLQPVHPVHGDVVSDVFVDEVGIVLERARHVHDFRRDRDIGDVFERCEARRRDRARGIISGRGGRRDQRRGSDRHCRQGDGRCCLRLGRRIE